MLEGKYNFYQKKRSENIISGLNNLIKFFKLHVFNVIYNLIVLNGQTYLIKDIFTGRYNFFA